MRFFHFLCLLVLVVMSTLSSAEAQPIVPLRIGQKLVALQSCQNGRGVELDVKSVDQTVGTADVTVTIYCWDTKPQSHRNVWHWGKLMFAGNTVSLKFTDIMPKFGVGMGDDKPPVGRVNLINGGIELAFDEVTLRGESWTATTKQLIFR